ESGILQQGPAGTLAVSKEHRHYGIYRNQVGFFGADTPRAAFSRTVGYVMRRPVAGHFRIEKRMHVRPCPAFRHAVEHEITAGDERGELHDARHGSVLRPYPGMHPLTCTHGPDAVLARKIQVMVVQA